MNIRVLVAIATTLILSGIVAAQNTPTKIGIVDSNAFFDEKAGVTKLTVATKQLNDEFREALAELDGLNKRLRALATELEALQKQPNPDQKILIAKSDEGQELQRTIKYKTEDAKDRYAKREQQLVGPIQIAVGKGLQEYAKAKGYALIFDAAKDPSGFLVAVGDQNVDVTKDFIAFYNARP